MRKPSTQHARGLAASLLIGLVVTTLAYSSHATGPDDTASLEAALNDLDQWIGDKANGDKWRKFLLSAELRKEIQCGREADPAKVSRALQQYRSGAKGLNKRRFVAVRGELQTWLDRLKNQHAADLPQLVWAVRVDHVPLSDERFKLIRDDLRISANELERTLGVGTQFALNWKAYLKWELLQSHLEGDANITGQSLKELDQVLKRFRMNQPGLENPAFIRVAVAIERYRELALWNALAKRRDTRPRYATYLKELQKQLTRQLEKPTVETSRQVGKVLGIMHHLGHSPQLVQTIRTQFNHPNVLADISESAINRLVGRPVSETRPVRDLILGARVYGSAHTRGQLSLHTLPAVDHVDVELRVAGQIQTNTLSFKKSVCVSSCGFTDYAATKRLTISDERFVVMPPVTSAWTSNRILSIRKTGGRFGHRLVERIARKQVAQKKPQTERIASKKAKKQVSEKLDKQVVQALHESRNKYVEKFRWPLERIGMFPAHLNMSSGNAQVRVQATLASQKQVTTAQHPPGKRSSNDITVQLHESAVNNFAPSLLAGIGLRQEKESDQAKLEGDVPSWLMKLAQEERNKPSIAPGNIPELTSPQNATDDKSDVGDTKSQFKPWSVRLNAEHPVSISFNDQRATIRVRFAELRTVEPDEDNDTVMRNWDLLVTYQMIQDGNLVILRREGDIEALPSGFDPEWFDDPRWDDKLSGRQVSLRKNLEKNINKRADQGTAFPREITIPALHLSRHNGTEQSFVLEQLDCDNGWLTIGYRVP